MRIWQLNFAIFAVFTVIALTYGKPLQDWTYGEEDELQPAKLLALETFRELPSPQGGSHHHHRSEHKKRGPHRHNNGERGPGGRRHDRKKEREDENGMPMPTPATDDMDMNQIMDYYKKYHYMGDNMPDREIAELVNTSMGMAVHEATKIFQRRYARHGLVETGELDEDTVSLMMKPRCGVPDINTMADLSNYVTSPARWEYNDLDYQVVQYPEDGDPGYEVVDQELRRAFNVWEEVSPLRFHRMDYADRSKKANIEIRFVRPYSDHGDGNAFDGPGGTLAHAFFPYPNSIFRGDTHFDEGETWTLTGAHGEYNLFQVAAHEIGHALGLAHSRDPSALMAPFYPGYLPNFVLPLDDEMGIQAIYGGPSRPMKTTTTTSTTTTARPTRPHGRPTTTTTTESPDPTPDICRDSSFDAITTIRVYGEYKTYGFRGTQYFLIDPRTGGIAEGYPRLIREGWPGLPNNIDAALFWDAGKEWMWDEENREWVREPAVTYVFKGSRYWVVEDMTVVDGPRHISEWGFPSRIDAAFVWGKNGKTYVFKGTEYYRYTRDEGLDSGYPRPISVWGLPDNIDAAFQYANGQSFFFKGNKFYGYNDQDLKVESGYPVESHGYWFRC